MENLKVVELREIARSRGLKGWYRLRKSDLISFIMEKEKEEITQGSGLRKTTPKDTKYHELDPGAEKEPNLEEKRKARR